MLLREYGQSLATSYTDLDFESNEPIFLFFFYIRLRIPSLKNRYLIHINIKCYGILLIYILINKIFTFYIIFVCIYLNKFRLIN